MLAMMSPKPRADPMIIVPSIRPPTMIALTCPGDGSGCGHPSLSRTVRRSARAPRQRPSGNDHEAAEHKGQCSDRELRTVLHVHELSCSGAVMGRSAKATS